MRNDIVFSVAVMVLAAMLTDGAAQAASYPVIYAFGDSLSDAGNDWTVTDKALPISPPYSDGRFSNGAVWVQDLALAKGAGTLKASLRGGTDFAYGGAASGPSIAHSLVPYDLPGQLAEFGITVASPNPNALCTLWIGSNDLLDILEDSSLTEAQVTQAVGQVVANEADFVTAIAIIGAKHLLVLNSPDLGTTPAVTSEGAAAVAAATALSTSFNAALESKLSSLASRYGIELTFVDTFALIDDAVTDPAKYQFKNVTGPCWTGGYTSYEGTLCSKAVIVQNRYLFWDTLHPTTHAHNLVAKAAATALAASTSKVARR